MPDRHHTKTYQELAMLLGQETADKLVTAYRGQELHIPPIKKLTTNHRLVLLLGDDIARRLCHYWGNTTLTLPMQLTKKIKQRNASIVEQYKAGATSNQLAAGYAITSRHVRKIVQQHNDAQAKETYARMQYQLFDH